MYPSRTRGVLPVPAKDNEEASPPRVERRSSRGDAHLVIVCSHHGDLTSATWSDLTSTRVYPGHRRRRRRRPSATLPAILERGGHLIEGYVRPTLELIVDEVPGHLRRRSDPDTGLALIALEDSLRIS
jgi:hypothetical protein